jgi:hypothetical protein
MGAVSSAHSWKNSMGRPSFPGALPLGRALIAVRISLNVSCLVKVSLISPETMVGTLVQHRCFASSVPGVFASEEYNLV